MTAARRAPRGRAALLAAVVAAWAGAAGLAAPAAAAPKKPASQPAPKGAPSVADLLARVEQARAGTETLVADFTQRKRLSLFKDELTSKGSLKFKRPNRLRWEYVAPEKSVILFDGARVTVRAPGAPPEVYDLAKQPGMQAVFDRILVWLGRGSLADAAKDYDVKVVGPAALRLTPKGSLAKHLIDVEMRFDAAWQLAYVQVREKSGDQTQITFTNLRRNVKLDDAVF
ncbi:MAG TPA: outer membrane lipoprotein carrier protein LolA, partial [Polyangia bacterium]